MEMNAELLDCLEDHARLLQGVGQFANAVRAFAAAATFREASGVERSPHRDAEKQASLQASREALGEAAFEASWSTGKKWALDETVDTLAAGQAVAA